MMTLEAILAELAKILEAREGNYNDPSQNFADIAVGFDLMLRIARKIGPDALPDARVDALDVARMLVVFKMCRDAYRYQPDNWFDGAGYSICGLRVGSVMKEMCKE